MKAAFLALGGLVLVTTAAWFAWDHARFLADAERADGLVIDVISRRGARGMTLHHPVVRYQPRGSVHPVQFTARPGLWPSPYERGDRVMVAYHPAEPPKARIVSFWMLWFLPLATVLLGVACGFAAWHTFSRRHPRARRTLS